MSLATPSDPMAGGTINLRMSIILIKGVTIKGDVFVKIHTNMLECKSPFKTMD